MTFYFFISIISFRNLIQLLLYLVKNIKCLFLLPSSLCNKWYRTLGTAPEKKEKNRLFMSLNLTALNIILWISHLGESKPGILLTKHKEITCCIENSFQARSTEISITLTGKVYTKGNVLKKRTTAIFFLYLPRIKKLLMSMSLSLVSCFLSSPFKSLKKD